jgi:hypothetical protein
MFGDLEEECKMTRMDLNVFTQLFQFLSTELANCLQHPIAGSAVLLIHNDKGFIHQMAQQFQDLRR